MTSPAADEAAAEVWPLTLEQVAALLPQFAILRLLGTGDLGAVYQALGPEAQPVAMKVLPLELSRTPGFAEAVAQVARQVIQLKHPGFVPLRAFGRTAGGHIFLVSDYVDGEALPQRLAVGRFIVPQAYSFVEQICDALQHAHGHGVVHGGLHPGNVFIDRSGRVRLLDTGFVPLVALGYAANASASHAAPEQLAGTGIDHRADLYSAGVLLYELLTGQLPHAEAAPASELAHAHPRIDAVIARAMNPQPELRYASAAEMLRAIVAVGALDGLKPAELAPKMHGAPVVAPAPVAVGRKKPPIARWGGLGVGALAVAAAIIFALNAGKKPAPAPRPIMKVAEFPTAISEPPVAKKQPAPQPARPAVAIADSRPASPPAKATAPASGPWQPVSLEESVSGATRLPGGGILLTRTVRLEKYRGTDVAVRCVMRMAESQKIVQLWLRSAAPARAQLTLNAKPACQIQTTQGDNKFVPFGEVTAPWAVLEDRWVTVEFAAVGDQLIGAVNGRPIEVAKPSDVLQDGVIGIFSTEGEIRSLDFALLDGVPREKYPDFVQKALAAADAARLAKAAAESKPMTPPEPEKPKASAEVQEWLAKVDGPFQEAFAREVTKPFDAAAGELRRAHLQALERQTTAAQSAGRLDESNLWRQERDRFFAHGQTVPPDDSDNPPPALRTLRAGFRTNFGRVDRARFERARGYFAKYDAVLSQNLAALTQRQRLDDAALLSARREQLNKEWLVPAIAVVVATPPTAAGKPAADAPKITLKEAVDWLLQNEAELEYYDGKKWNRVLDARLLPNGRISYGLRIDSAKLKSPLTPDDLRRLTGLRTVERLEIGAALPDAAFDFLGELTGVTRVQFPGDKLTDAIVDTLGGLSELRGFQIRGGSNLTGRTLDQLARLPNLHHIDLENSGVGDEGATALAKIESLEELNLRRTRLTDAGLASIAKLRKLRRLEIDHCAGITTAGLAILKPLRNLELIDFLHDGLKDYAAAVKALMTNCDRVAVTRVRGRGLTGEHIAPLAEWRSLTHVTFPDAGFAGDGSAALAKLTRIEFLELNGCVFTDVDLDHLLGLKELRKLNLTGTQITDAGLLKVKALKGLKEVNVNNTPVTVGGVRQFEREHPGCRVVRNLR